MNIAERLEQLMTEKNINRRQLSIAANIPYTTLDGIHKRSCDNVKLSTLIKLADYFETSLDYLVGRGPDADLNITDLKELESFRKYLEWRNANGQTQRIW